MNLRRLRQVLTLGALALALAHLIWPTMAIDSITVVLVLVALVPWVAPLFKTLEFPGGWKVEFQDLQKTTDKADAAGLLAPAADAVTEQDYAFQRVAEQDPNLALAGLRIEIERRLLSLAAARGVDARRAGIRSLLRELSNREVLNEQERSVLSDMVDMLNHAVHGAEVDRRGAEWAMNVGPRVLASLDQRIREKKE